jgi:DNA ligase (NAD+)
VDPTRDGAVMRAAAARRVARLRRLIRHHDRLYYEHARPEIADAEYDALVRELRALEARFPALVTPDSPTQRVAGAATPAFQPVAHRVAMLSLDSVATSEEVVEFERRLARALPGVRPTYVCEPKVDGLGVALLYRHGRLVRGATRGDGRTGEGVTANLRTIRRIPAVLRGPLARLPEIEVRGEVFMPRRQFARLNRALETAGEATFANPRNAAAGAVRQKDPAVTARRPLEAFIYQLSYPERPPFRTHWDALAALAAAGLPVNPRNCRHQDLVSVRRYCGRLARERHRLRYEADGVVVKVDALDLQRRVGATGHHPRWAIAFKFAARQATTRVKAIVVQIGRTGALTPVAHVEPVELGGVVIRRASLHNEDEIRRKDIRIGDAVLLERAGDVIPAVVQVVRAKRPRGARPFRLPRRCPMCGGVAERLAGEAVRRCLRATCPAQVKGRLRHFGSRRALDITHLGPVVIDALVERGLVREFSDLYRLTPAKLASLPHFGARSARNLIDAIAASRERGLARLLNGLGIRMVGAEVARRLAERFGILDRLMAARGADLAAIPGIGPRIAASVSHFFSDAGNRRVCRRLKAAGVRVVERAVGWPAGRLSGKTFVLTGMLGGLGRAEARRLIEGHGGRVADAVSQRTDVVVVGEAPGQKLAEARRLGIRTVDERQFRRLVGRGAGRRPTGSPRRAIRLAHSRQARNHRP